jgi:DNA-binding beta-propeller fold protein YncE
VATLGDERTFYHGNARLFEFDPTGKFVKEIGQGTYGFDFAQQVRVDPQDNIWAVDAGSNVLTKFDPEGRLLMVIGRKPEAIAVRPGPGMPARLIDDDTNVSAPPRGAGRGSSQSAPGAGTRSESFNRPTDIAFDRQGHVYVADGIGTNNRIAVFNRDGN